MKSSGLLHLVVMLVLISVPYELGLATTPQPTHDVAITRILTLSEGARDYTVPVVINIENQGKSSESFNVKLIDVTGGKEIGIKSVTLPVSGGGGIDGNCDLTFTGESGCACQGPIVPRDI